MQSLRSRKDSYCSVYSLYIIYLTKNLGKDFKSAVLDTYNQSFS